MAWLAGFFGVLASRPNGRAATRLSRRNRDDPLTSSAVIHQFRAPALTAFCNYIRSQLLYFNNPVFSARLSEIAARYKAPGGFGAGFPFSC